MFMFMLVFLWAYIKVQIGFSYSFSTFFDDYELYSFFNFIRLKSVCMKMNRTELYDYEFEQYVQFNIQI